MKLESDRVSQIRVGLADKGVSPPRQLVYGLLAIAPDLKLEQCISVVEWDDPNTRNNTRWTLLARIAGGLVIATGRTPSRWDWQNSKPLVEAEISIDWVPLHALRQISATNVDFETDHEGNAWVSNAWTITVGGRDPIVLTADTEKEASQIKWLTELRVAASGASSAT